jgi:two-component system cell cycle sensor histidine kinase/response regulator CckA
VKDRPGAATKREDGKVARARGGGQSAPLTSEERFRAIADYTVDWESWFGPDGACLWVNPAVERMTGYPPDEVRAMPDLASVLIAEEDRSIFAARFREALAGSRGEDLELRYVHRDGTILWCSASWQPIADAKGNPMGVRTSIRDITKRKQVETALRESEEKYRALIDAAEEAIVVAKDGRVVFANRKTSEGLGLTFDEIVGKSFLDHVAPDDRQLVAEMYARRLEGEPIPAYDFRIVTPGGKTTWLLQTGTVIQWEGGTATLNMATDITERKLAEEALRSSQELLNNLARLVPGVIYQYRLYPDGRSAFPWASPGMNDIYEVTPEEVREDATPVFGRLHPDDYDRVAANIAESARTLDTFYCEFRVVLPRQGLRWRWSQAHPIRMEDGGTLWHGIISDITEQKQTEEALRDANRRLESIIEGTQVGTWEWNVQTGETVFNDAWARMFGYELSELSPTSIKTCEDLAHPEDLQRSHEMLERHFKGELPAYDCEVRMKHRDGRWIWVHGRGKVVSWVADGKPLMMFGTHANVTSRKEAEANEQHIKDILSETGRIARVGGWELDLVTGLSTWTDEIYRIFEIDPTREILDEVPERPKGLDMYAPEFRPALATAVEATMTQGEPYDLEVILIGEKGGRRWVRTTGRLIERDGHKVMAGTMQDINERRTAEEALKQSKERLELALEGGTLGIWDWNPQTDAVAFSDLWARMLGYSPDEVEPTGEFFRERIHPDDREAVLARLAAHIDGRAPTYSSEHRLRAKSGGWIWVLDQGKIAERSDDDHPARMTGVIADITARKVADEQRIALEAQLRQAQKMESVGRLAGGVAHDFNNMLGVILGHTEMALGRVDPDQPLHGDLLEVYKAAERSANLTQLLLAFARKQTVAPEVLNLNTTIGGMLNMLKRLIGEDIDLHWEPQDGLWPVRMDPSQIDQLLVNLCVNARDAIEDVGSISIEASNVVCDAPYSNLHAAFTPGEYVRLAVTDDGCGMDKETLAQVFEPFFTTKTVGMGTGLGLAMVYGVVTQNDGFINVYSEPDHGTSFAIYLPRHAGKADEALPQSEAEPPMRGNETILLVEDEPSILGMTAKMLEMQGYVVIGAGSPGEAIRLAREHHGEICLLMTDVVMPEMNGRDLARNVLTLYPHIKRLFTSGYTADVIAHRGVLDEGVHFLQKPFSMQSLAAKIREALDEE